ncbi:MAG: hypothetical protein KC547_11700 [Anaerolineae bacterium]|nr:hypothetical protein [Anaerolineae bacterium]
MNEVLLIADSTESAVSCWSHTAQAIAELLTALPTQSVARIALLGTNFMWPVDAWRPDVQLPTGVASICSLVAPVLVAVKERGLNPRWIVIVGAGEVFDLPDWTAAGMNWALLCTGDSSLRATDDLFAEFVAPDGIAALVNLLKTDATVPLQTKLRELTGAIQQQWALDPTGYPMIYVPPLNAFMHLFPVAKSQFEAFLAATPSPDRGDAWYTELLTINPRLSPWSASLVNYEQLLVTGLLPEETEAFAAFLGHDFRIPDVESWRAAYDWLAQQEMSVLTAGLEYAMAPTARRMWHGLLATIHPGSLLELSLMQGGVVEWTTLPDGRFVALGKPRDIFDPSFRDPLYDRPWEPTVPIRRSKRFGVRLMRSA